MAPPAPVVAVKGNRRLALIHFRRTVMAEAALQGGVLHIYMTELTCTPHHPYCNILCTQTVVHEPTVMH